MTENTKVYLTLSDGSKLDTFISKVEPMNGPREWETTGVVPVNILVYVELDQFLDFLGRKEE